MSDTDERSEPTPSRRATYWPALVPLRSGAHDVYAPPFTPIARFPRLRRVGGGKAIMLVSFPRPQPRLVPPYMPSGRTVRVERKALAMWPRLDHRALRRCHGDTRRIAAQIAHRTKMAPGLIEKLISDC